MSIGVREPPSESDSGLIEISRRNGIDLTANGNGSANGNGITNSDANSSTNGNGNDNGSGNGNGGSDGNGAGKHLLPLHRIRTVRRQQGMSVRTAARHLGVSVREASDQENERNDLRLNELYQWQAALDVPLAELLVDPDTPLSRPVRERAQLVRIMKTAATLLEVAPTQQTSHLAQNLVEQLITLMPELQGIGPWHSVGQRRSLDEYGAIMERRLPDDLFHSTPLDLEE